MTLHINKLELDRAPSGLLALFAASSEATKDSFFLNGKLWGSNQGFLKPF
jgi:hypothetical protein